MASALSTVGSYQSIETASADVAPAQQSSQSSGRVFVSISSPDSGEVCNNETCRKATACCGCVILVLGGVLATVGGAVHSKELVAAGIVMMVAGFASCFSSLGDGSGSSRGGSMPMGLR